MSPRTAGRTSSAGCCPRVSPTPTISFRGTGEQRFIRHGGAPTDFFFRTSLRLYFLRVSVLSDFHYPQKKEEDFGKGCVRKESDAQSIDATASLLDFFFLFVYE
jgi:hypothetical protein